MSKTSKSDRWELQWRDGWVEIKRTRRRLIMSKTSKSDECPAERDLLFGGRTWKDLADAGRMLKAAAAYTRQHGCSMAEASRKVEEYNTSKTRRPREG